MARQFDGFEDRLAHLESGDHRAQFDSKVRCLITDSVEALPARRTDGDEHVTRLIALMEDLAKRMDVLDRKNRNLAEEMRQRERRDRRRRRSVAAVAAVAAVMMALGVGGWAKIRMEAAPAASVPLD